MQLQQDVFGWLSLIWHAVQLVGHLTLAASVKLGICDCADHACLTGGCIGNFVRAALHDAVSATTRLCPSLRICQASDSTCKLQVRIEGRMAC
jgi:hypothetical protein